MWVTGFGGTFDAVRQVHRHPAGKPPRQRGHDDLVDLFPAGELADRVDRGGIDDLAVGLGASLVQPGQLVLQPRRGQCSCDLVGAWDHPAIQPVAGPSIGGLGLGHRDDDIEAARSGARALGKPGRELFAAQGLVGHDEVPAHDLTPFGLVCPPRL
jgi:hypothetical protein